MTCTHLSLFFQIISRTDGYHAFVADFPNETFFSDLKEGKTVQGDYYAQDHLEVHFRVSPLLEGPKTRGHFLPVAQEKLGVARRPCQGMCYRAFPDSQFQDSTNVVVY